MYLNKAIVFGNLTRDPELKALPSGVKVTSFSIATNRVYKDKAGAKQEQTEFHNIVTFGRQAELAAQYLRKGATALIEGRLQTRSWDADGGKKYRTEILAESIQFGPRGGGMGGAGDSSAPKSSGKPSDNKKAEPLDTIEYPAEEINPDDIPF